MWRSLIALITVAACNREPPPPRVVFEPPAPPPSAPPRIELGSCAMIGNPFVAGSAPSAPAYYLKSSEFGTWGTISHGWGIGGGNSRPGVAVTQMRIGTVAVVGADADTWRAIVRRHVKRKEANLSYCYDKQRNVSPELAGTMAVTLAFDVTGKLATPPTIAAPFDAALADCVTSTLATLELPKPGSSIVATVPLEFLLADNVAKLERVRALARTAIGAANPLEARRGELETCLRTTPEIAAGVVDLRFDAAGVATEATVHGTPSPCVSRVAIGARNTSRASSMRCGFAVGSDAAQERPKLVILNNGDVTYGGETQSLEALRTLIPTLAPTVQGDVTVKGPLLIEPSPHVGMLRVREIVLEANDQDLDTVFVTQHAFGGTRLVGRSLPLVPKLIHSSFAAGSMPALLIVHADRFSIGDDEVTGVPELAAALGRARRPNSPRMHIVFAEDVPFERFLRIVDVAVVAGFTDWSI